MASSLPAKVIVESVVDSRYQTKNISRPADWDQRKAGYDTVKLSTGQKIKLQSNGGQSVPQPGWILMLTAGSLEEGYVWTLYGFLRAQAA